MALPNYVLQSSGTAGTVSGGYKKRQQQKKSKALGERLERMIEMQEKLDGKEEKMANQSSGSSSDGEFTLRTTRSQLRERGPNDSHLL